MKTIACHHCKHVWTFEPPMGRGDVCPKCGNDSRVCKNCRFFDLNSYRSCREEQSEWVKEKDRGNFCGFFESKESEAPASQPLDLSDELAEFLKKRQK
jgi:hypothetical protein